MMVIERVLRLTRLVRFSALPNVVQYPGAVGCSCYRDKRHLTSSAVVSSTPKIYTRTGDRGKSSTFTGKRLPKDHEIFHALGAIDELSSWLGVSRVYAAGRKHSYVDHLVRIQCILQDVMAVVATPKSSSGEKHQHVHKILNTSVIEELEAWIDEYSADLPPLNNFILPGGSVTSAHLHVSRSVCRRAERAVVPLLDSMQLDPICLKYLNRLSDYLFTIARYASHTEGKEETIYTKP